MGVLDGLPDTCFARFGRFAKRSTGLQSAERKVCLLTSVDDLRGAAKVTRRRRREGADWIHPLSQWGGPQPQGVSMGSVENRYDEVQQMFRELRSLPVDSAEFAHLRDRIVEQGLPLADHIARRYSGRGESHDDLVQVARVGLLNAVKRFDPEAGDFLGFAVPTMMGEVKRYFRDFSWSVKVPRRLKDVYPQLGVAMNDVAQRLGRTATASELAAEMRVDLKVAHSEGRLADILRVEFLHHRQIQTELEPWRINLSHQVVTILPVTNERPMVLQRHRHPELFTERRSLL